MTVQVAVIYYSSTGTVHALAQAVAEGATTAGAEVRLRRAAELAPADVIDQNPMWRRHADATASVPVAELDDLAWADAFAFGTPTRFGTPAAQLKQFLDTLGPQWAQGQLANKIYSGFTSTGTAHGGQESTLLALYNTVHHFGGIIVPPGYTDPSKFVDGNPYGASHISANGANPPQEQDLTAVAYSAKRATEIAAQLKRGAAAA